jgi:L-iditol 2-dehydrogenase
MKSAWITGKRSIEVKEEAYRKPGPDEVVVQINTCGICGTDLHFYRDFPQKGPIPLGHEVAGAVYEPGGAVTDLQIGQSVVVQNHVSCGSCEPCLQGRPAHCRNIQTYMDDRAGMAEYLRVPKEMVVPYSELDFSEAALAEPLTVALDVVQRARLEPFQDVCISGPGIIGLFCTGLAAAAGASNVAVLGRSFRSERGRRRIEAAKSMGATEIFDTDERGWLKEAKREFPEGFHKIIVTSPPRTIPPLFDLASFGADIVFNGISFAEEAITFNANAFHFKKLTLAASHAIPNWGFPLAFKLLSQDVFKHKKLITHSFPLEQIEEAFVAAGSAEQGAIKVLITF